MSGDLVGSRISLISRKDIRWEGILVQVDRENASVTLQNGERVPLRAGHGIDCIVGTCLTKILLFTLSCAPVPVPLLRVMSRTIYLSRGRKGNILPP